MDKIYINEQQRDCFSVFFCVVVILNLISLHQCSLNQLQLQLEK